jgi:hypothetical protein
MLSAIRCKCSAIRCIHATILCKHSIIMWRQVMTDQSEGDVEACRVRAEARSVRTPARQGAVGCLYSAITCWVRVELTDPVHLPPDPPDSSRLPSSPFQFGMIPITATPIRGAVDSHRYDPASSAHLISWHPVPPHLPSSCATSCCLAPLISCAPHK